MPRRDRRFRLGRTTPRGMIRGLESLESRLPMAADAAVWAGDANIDGRFDSADLVLTFQHGKYETESVAHWDQGDWNLDRRFNASDLVIAFQTGCYDRTLNPEPGQDDSTSGSEIRDPDASGGGDAGTVDLGTGDATGGDTGTGEVWVALANDDSISRKLPASSSQVPGLDIDVLENDSADVVEIRSIGEPIVGMVERLPGAGPNGRELLRYVPGPSFRYWDRFSYTVADAAGNEATAWVVLDFTQDSGASQFATRVPNAIATDAGVPIDLKDESGDALVQIDYDGPSDMTLGVHIYWVRRRCLTRAMCSPASSRPAKSARRRAVSPRSRVAERGCMAASLK